MKSIRELFKNKEHLLDEPEVEKLLDYCEQLQDEIVDFKFEKNYNKETVLIDMIKEVLKDCKAIQKEQLEHERFGFESPNYQETIKSLEAYLLKRCDDERIRL